MSAAQMRGQVVEQMVAVHQVRRELAEEWVAAMEEDEVVERFRRYSQQRTSHFEIQKGCS